MTGIGPLLRRRRIMEYLTAYVSAYGYPPAYQEIAAHVGKSDGAVIHRDLWTLQNLGYIARTRGVRRGLRVLVPFIVLPYAPAV